MDYAKESLRLHGEWKGKIEVVATVPVGDAIQKEFIQLRDECGLDYKFPFEK